MVDWRYIHETTGKAGPGLVVFLDTESNLTPKADDPDTELQTLRLGVAHFARIVEGKLTRQQTFRFTSTGEFWDWMNTVSHPKIPIWLFAHNLPYDLTTTGFGDCLRRNTFRFSGADLDAWGKVPEAGKKNGWEGFIVDSDPPTIIKCRHRNGWTLIAVDTLNYWKCPLWKMGERLGVPKGKVNFKTATDEELFAYCEQDVEILKQSVLGLLGFIRKHDLGSFKFTAPSLAMEAYRHRFIGRKICTHNVDSVKLLERAGYLGGRLEMFAHGLHLGMFYSLDVKSMYPFVMEDNLYPRKLYEWHTNDQENTLSISELELGHIAEVKIETRGPTYPLRFADATVYPVGTYWTTLCGPELMRAKREGSIVSIGKWSKYSMNDLFSNFVRYFCDAREEAKAVGDDVEADLLKLYANSFYGKWGQKTGGWEHVELDIGIAEWKPTYFCPSDLAKTQKYRSIAGYVQKQVPKEEHDAAFPAIAAFVTAYAREYLLSLIMTAGLQNTYYTVTDSLIVNQEGLDRLQAAGVTDGAQRGVLEPEHSARFLKLNSLHQYRMGTRSKHGSMKSNGTRKGWNKVEETRFQGLKSLLSDGWPAVVEVTKVSKTFRMEYNRGIKQPGGRITPLVVNFPVRNVANQTAIGKRLDLELTPSQPIAV